MALRSICAGLLAAITISTPLWAEPKAITQVTRVLPSQSAIELPALPNLETPRLTSVSVVDPDRTHRSAWLNEHDDISAFGLPCGASISATLISENLHEITVSAPCRPHEMVAFAVNGLRFDQSLSLTGEARFAIPVVASSAMLETVFSDQSYHKTQLPAANTDTSLRVALAWKENSDARLTAKDHTVITVGNGPHQLQILTVDQVENASHVVRLAIRRDVTEGTCNTPASAQFFRQDGTGHPTRYDLSFAPISCENVGTTLELKNVLEDLKIASN